MLTNDMTRGKKWTEVEKKAARSAFDAALARETTAIRKKVEEMLNRSAEPAQVWEILGYLSKKQEEIDWKYDYRYSVLIDVFGRLLGEGWLSEAELAKLHPDKLMLIKRISAGFSRSDA
jgi:hypothetical protein